MPKDSSVKEVIVVTGGIGISNPTTKKIISEMIYNNGCAAGDNHNDIEERESSEVDFIPNYKLCWLLAEAANVDLDKLTEHSIISVHRLLRIRSSNAMKSNKGTEMSKKIRSLHQEWRICINDAKSGKGRRRRDMATKRDHSDSASIERKPSPITIQPALLP